MRHQEDPFVAAERHDPGLSEGRVERAAAPAGPERQRTPNPQLGARNESSVLFNLSDIQAASASSCAADEVPIHHLAAGADAGRQPRPTGFIEFGHFEPSQSMATIVPIGLLQPRGTSTYIPRWVWGLAAGGAALLIAVVCMTFYLVRSPAATTAELSAAEPATATPQVPSGPAAAPHAPLAPVKLAATAPSKPAAVSSTAPVARVRVKAHGGKRSARRAARTSSKSALPARADAPAPRAKASGRDELDKILGGSVAH